MYPLKIVQSLVDLIKRLVLLSTTSDSLILDSFAGTGTTAHAVLALNKEDSGNRKFILMECEDYTDTITAERVRRVINNHRTGRLLLRRNRRPPILSYL
ncbi:site-specific DNA-methyltransferase [Candidatus Poribacteria bacterium]|nr:site-specific DNA-methyltransferase [Candidatus Poribacteria bacterium]MYA55533.1 site-specific DNA-methyltransferase [Candidatus Poribacteria bacterium]